MSETDASKEHVLRNREVWDVWARDFIEPGERAWAQAEPSWGIWGIPESGVGLLPDAAWLAGRDAIELGCGTGYVSAWLARRGARPVGIDNSGGQLATARRLQREHALAYPLVHGNAEALPFADASFDFAISEYGACLWADPERWVPEAARVLRPGGRLHFLTNAFLLMLCVPEDEKLPATERLQRSAFGMRRLVSPTDGASEFHIPHGEWIALLRRHGFEVEELRELRPPEDAATRYTFVTKEWALQWPSEEVWKVRRRA